jgi:hypothetical protein
MWLHFGLLNDAIRRETDSACEDVDTTCIVVTMHVVCYL